MTLLGSDEIFPLCTVLVGLAWFGFWADSNRLGKTTSGVLWVIVGGVALSNLAEAVVAAGAALVGPAPTAAIAAARGWKALVTPGIMCGILGYAIGTFIGVLVAKLLM